MTSLADVSNRFVDLSVEVSEAFQRQVIEVGMVDVYSRVHDADIDSFSHCSRTLQLSNTGVLESPFRVQNVTKYRIY